MRDRINSPRESSPIKTRKFSRIMGSEIPDENTATKVKTDSRDRINGGRRERIPEKESEKIPRKIVKVSSRVRSMIKDLVLTQRPFFRRIDSFLEEDINEQIEYLTEACILFKFEMEKIIPEIKREIKIRPNQCIWQALEWGILKRKGIKKRLRG